MTGQTTVSRRTMPMMQHDLFANPNPRSRRAYPLVVVLQADAAEGETRLIAPLAPHAGPLASGTSRALPVIGHNDRRYAVALPLISALRATDCERRWSPWHRIAPI